jgi:hypothetical protein
MHQLKTELKPGNKKLVVIHLVILAGFKTFLFFLCTKFEHIKDCFASLAMTATNCHCEEFCVAGFFVAGFCVALREAE